MGWMHDMLDYMAYDPIYRRYHHNLITFSLMYAFSEHFLLPLSHDEVVHLKNSLLNKMPGDGWQQFANLRTLFGYMFSHPGKKLLFMGGEFGQRAEWTETQSLDWHELNYESHQKLHRYVHDLVHVYTSEPALWQIDNSWEGFQWMAANDNENSVISFARCGQDPNELILVVCNFTPQARYNYCIPAPRAGFYQEILNSDSESYWGSNLGNMGGAEAYPQDWSSTGYAICLTLPPLSTLLLKASPRPPEAAAETPATQAAVETPTVADALNAPVEGQETVSTTVIEENAASPPTKRTRKKVAPPAEAVTEPADPAEPAPGPEAAPAPRT
jgi:1,4-alpha-glucan branching enzyme